MTAKVQKIVLPFLVFSMMILIWEFYFSKDLNDVLVLPPPSLIVRRLFQNYDRFFYHSIVTFFEIMGGISLAFLFAFPLAFLMFISKTARVIFQPFFVFVQCIPMFALAPIMVFWFGWTYTAIVVPTALMIFFPLTIAIFQGLNSAPQNLMDYFHINQASRRQIFFKLQLPSSLPHLFSGFKVAMATGGIGAVAGEFAGGKSGLGILMLESRRATDLETTFAALVCLSLMSMTMYLLILIMEKIMIKKYRLIKSSVTTLMILVSFILTSCSGNDLSQQKVKTTELLLDWLPNPNHIPLYVGIEKEIFKKYGIHLEIRKIPDPSDAIPYLMAGKADLALFYMPDTLRAIEAGYQLEGIGVLFKQPLNAIIYRAHEGIEKPTDLNGLTIGYSVDGTSTKVLDYLLKRNQIEPKEKQNVTFDLVSTLCSKKVDAIYGAYWNIECEHLRFLNQNTEYFELSNLGYPNYYELIVVANSQKKEADPIFVEAFKNALQESIDYSVRHVNEAFMIYAKANPDKSSKTLTWEEASWKRTFSLLAKNQDFDAQMIENLRNWLIRENLIH